MARRQNEDTQEGDAPEEGGSRVYELGFHIDPELPAEGVKKAYQDMRAAIAAQGSVVAESEPLSVKLAYTISRQETGGRRDFNSAQFAWVAYETSAENHDAVRAAAKADTRLIRFIDLVTNKDAARHAEEARALSAKTAEEGLVDAADAALDAALEQVEA